MNASARVYSTSPDNHTRTQSIRSPAERACARCMRARAHNHLCFRLSGTKMFHQELRFCWAVRPTLLPPPPPPLMLLLLPVLPSPRSTGVSSSIDDADVIMPLRRRRSIFACHDERRRFSLLTVGLGGLDWFGSVGLVHIDCRTIGSANKGAPSTQCRFSVFARPIVAIVREGILRIVWTFGWRTIVRPACECTVSR